MRINHTVATAMSIAMLAFTFIACETDKAKAQEIGLERGNWIKQQQLYAIENGKFGNFTQIKYTAPAEGNFTYSSEIKNGGVYWIAKNKEDLGKCPAGSQWILLIKNPDETKVEAVLPENKSCQELTSNFTKN